MAALGLSEDPNLLDAERIGGLFRAVDSGLSGSGLRSPVEIVVVGGAALAMQWDQARTTYDVDVVSEGIPSVFWDLVAEVGRDEGLGDGWLNAAARVKAPTGPTPGAPGEVYLGSNLRLYMASAHYVLAMKLLSGRLTDRADMPALLEAHGRIPEMPCTTWSNAHTRRLISSPPPVTSSTKSGTITPPPPRAGPEAEHVRSLLMRLVNPRSRIGRSRKTPGRV